MTNDMNLGPYVSLLRRFIAGDISANEFEGRYLRTFKEDLTRRPRRIYDTLDRLFGDVDAFVADDDLRDDGDLDESGLLASARRTLSDLEHLEPRQTL